MYGMAAPVYTIDQVLKSSPEAVVTTEGYLLINEDEPVDQNCRDGMSKRMLDEINSVLVKASSM